MFCDDVFTLRGGEGKRERLKSGKRKHDMKKSFAFIGETFLHALLVTLFKLFSFFPLFFSYKDSNLMK
jgi:hypothetical protein